MKKLGFGCMRLPIADGKIDMAQFTAMVDRFMEQGFTYFDTSYVYHNGDSEKVLKEALVERYPRDSYTITTKSPVFMIDSKEKLKAIFAEQLERLGTDYVDYYWLHAINTDGYETMKKHGLVEAMNELKASGKVKHIGMSYHDSPELLDEILTRYPELEYVQLQLNYFDWESPYVAARRCYDVCTKHGKPVIVMEPVKGGELVKLDDALEKKLKAVRPELSIPSWAIRFCASLDNVFMVLSGMSDMAQMDDNTSFMKDFVPFDAAESRAIEEVAAALRAEKAYALEGLPEAEAVCPKNIGIVKIAEMMNDHIAMHSKTNTCIYYNVYLGSKAPASACDGCGKCAGKAGFDIPEMLKKADETITHF